MKFIPVAIAKGPNYIVQLVLSQFPLSCDVHVVLSTKFRLLHTDVHTYMCKYVCRSYVHVTMPLSCSTMKCVHVVVHVVQGEVWSKADYSYN